MIHEREHEPAAEAVVHAAGLANEQPRRLEFALGETVLEHPFVETAPSHGSEPHAELLADTPAESAPLEIRAGGLPLATLPEEAGVERGGAFEEGEKVLVAGVVALGATAIVELDGHGEALGQLLHDLDEREVLESLQEGEDVAALAAPEAVVEPLVGAHREGGGLLLVEGAQSGVGGAALAQARVAGHHVDDVRRRKNRFNAGVLDKGAHRAPPWNGHVAFLREGKGARVYQRVQERGTKTSKYARCAKRSVMPATWSAAILTRRSRSTSAAIESAAASRWSSAAIGASAARWST